MDVYLSEKQLQLRAQVRAFLDENYPPERILQMEKDEEYPDGFYRDCAKRGWTGIPVPVEHGGSDGSVPSTSAQRLLSRVTGCRSIRTWPRKLKTVSPFWLTPSLRLTTNPHCGREASSTFSVILVA